MSSKPQTTLLSNEGYIHDFKWIQLNGEFFDLPCYQRNLVFTLNLMPLQVACSQGGRPSAVLRGGTPIRGSVQSAVVSLAFFHFSIDIKLLHFLQAAQP